MAFLVRASVHASRSTDRVRISVVGEVTTIFVADAVLCSPQNMNSTERFCLNQFVQTTRKGLTMLSKTEMFLPKTDAVDGRLLLARPGGAVTLGS